MYTSDKLIKEWLFSSTENRYIHRVLSDEKEIEVDIDGTIYFHIKLPFKKSHFLMLKNCIDEEFVKDGHSKFEDSTEYYYFGDLTLLSNDNEWIYIEVTCSNNQQLEVFLRWDLNTVTIMDFLRTCCK
jgi:hypothetical protein